MLGYALKFMNQHQKYLLNDNIYADKTFQWYNIWILKRPYWSKPQTGVINCRIETRKGS